MRAILQYKYSSQDRKIFKILADKKIEILKSKETTFCNYQIEIKIKDYDELCSLISQLNGDSSYNDGVKLIKIKSETNWLMSIINNIFK